jgi:RNA polymerase sigma-70 factor (ECF subfamily)
MTDVELTTSDSRLNLIATQWSMINDPTWFIVRYGPAIRHYLLSLVKNSDDADEVAQEFFLRVLKQGFVRASGDRGRFRNYLITAVRNAALTHLKRKGSRYSSVDVEKLPAAADPADGDWLAQWRKCVLKNVWRSLECHQQRVTGNLFHTVLLMSVDFPNDDSPALAARVREKTGMPLRPDAFRKQLSRARRKFAELLIAEVTATLDNPTPEDVTEELREFDLLKYVRAYLPSDWQAWATRADQS